MFGRKDESQQEEKPKAEDKPKEGDLPSRKELVAAFKEKFGRNPSNKLSVEDLYNAINEKD